MCKYTNNGYNFLSLDNKFKLFLTKEELDRNKELENMFFNEIRAKGNDVLISKDTFKAIQDIREMMLNLIYLNNTHANKIMAGECLKDTEKALKNSYKKFNSLLKNAIQE